MKSQAYWPIPSAWLVSAGSTMEVAVLVMVLGEVRHDGINLVA